MDGCIKVELSDLLIDYNQKISLGVTNSNVVKVRNCDIKNGNHAMVFDGCKNLDVIDCNACENENNTSFPNPLQANAIVSVSNCNNVLLDRVNVNNNVKAIPGQGTGPFASLGPEVGVLLILAGSNITLKGCQTNHNSTSATMRALYILGTIGPIPSLNSVVIENHQSNNNTGDFSGNSGSLSGISITGGPGTKLVNCDTSYNVSSDQPPGEVFLTQGFTTGITALFSESIYITNHSANYNISEGAETFGVVIGDASGGLVIENSTFNHNGSIDNGSITAGIDLSFGTTATGSKGAIIRNCIASHNKANFLCAGLVSNWGSVLIQDCNFSYNESIGGKYTTTFK